MAKRIREIEAEKAEAMVEKAAGSYVLLPIGTIEASALNPRKSFDLEALEELAALIRTHGLQQPIVVRFGGDKHKIIMGERRYRACVMAGLTEIPAIVRYDVETDAQHIELALVENLGRRDLSALEEAEGYAALIGLGWKVVQVAERVGRSAPAVSNAIRLLKLPEAVRAAIADGRLPASSGRELVRFADFPALCEVIAEMAIERGTPSKDLASGIPFEWDIGHSKPHALVRISYDFDVTPCRECPFSAYRTGGGSGGVCLRPEHYHQLVAEAAELREAVKREVLEAHRAELAASAAGARANGNRVVLDAVSNATNAPNREQRESGDASAPRGVLDVRKLSHNEYESCSVAPAGCSEECPCRVKALGHGDRVGEYCLDPKRYKRLQAAESRTRNKDLKTTIAEEFAALEPALEFPFSAGVSALIASEIVSRLSLEVKRKCAADDQCPGQLSGVLSANGYGNEVRDAFAALPVGKGLSLIARFLAIDAADTWLKSGRARSQTFDYVQSLTPSPSPASGRGVTDAEVDPSQMTLGDLPGVMEEADGAALLERFLAPGEVAELYPDGSIASIGERDGDCARCHAPITLEMVSAAAGEFGPGVSRFDSGVIAIPAGLLYCATCAPTVKVCRVCGCTDEAACAGGCFWAEPDLCSACVEIGAAVPKPLCVNCGVRPAVNGAMCNSCDPSLVWRSSPSAEELVGGRS